MLQNYKSLINEICSTSPLIGQALVHHRNTRGLPMSFVNSPFLAQMYNDIPKLENVCVRKAVQTGLSELFICLTLWHSGWHGKIVAYILPTFSVRDRFVSSRVNKVIMSSKSYRDLLPRGKDQGNNRMKRFGSGSMMFLGSNTTGDFVEFSADTLIVDEIDQCDADNLTKAKDRIRASQDPKIYHIGNPTLPNVGISSLFNESDQRFFYTKCPHCNQWQTLDWFKNIVEKNDSGDWVPRYTKAKHAVDFNNITKFEHKVLPICIKCNEPFQRQDKGEWIAHYQDRKKAGYSMSRLDILSQDLSELYKEWILAQGNTARISTFYTSVLGTPFEFAGARITPQMLQECTQPYEMDYGGGEEYKEEIVSMGVDVGSLLHVMISITEIKNNENFRKTMLVLTCRNFTELQDLIIRYNVDCCVIDSMPETRKAQELRDWAIQQGTTVWLARFFPTPRVGNQKYGRKLDWRSKTVTTDRTQIMDTTFDEIRYQQRSFPQNVATVLGFNDQMKAPVRVLDQQRSRIVWMEGNAPDHFRFADVYDKIANDLAAMSGTFSAL